MTYEKKDQGAIITLNTQVTCVYVTSMWFFGDSNKNDSEASLNLELLSRKYPTRRRPTGQNRRLSTAESAVTERCRLQKGV